MPDQLLLDVCSVLIRYVVQQVADTPCHMYLFCVLEVRTVNAGGRNTIEWAEFILLNRNNNTNIQAHDYDIVIGPIADDTVGLQLRRFIQGYINISQLVNELS